MRLPLENRLRPQPLIERAMAGWRQLEHGERSDIRRIAAKLDSAYLKLQHWHQRVELCQEMACEEEALTPPDLAEAGEWWWRCAVSLRALDRGAESVPLFKKALALFEMAKGPDTHEVSTVLRDLGLTYLAQNRFAAAKVLFKRAAAIRLKADSALKNVASISELQALRLGAI